MAWFSGLVNKQNGFLDDAIADLRRVVATDFAEARRREFDFSQDYRALNELGQTLLERARAERGDTRRDRREVLLKEARRYFEAALAIDVENATAHHNLSLLLAQLGDPEGAERHRTLHERYRPDDNAAEHAAAIHRRSNPAANHAAEAVVLYDLQRPGTFGLPSRAADGSAATLRP